MAKNQYVSKMCQKSAIMCQKTVKVKNVLKMCQNAGDIYRTIKMKWSNCYLIIVFPVKLG